MPDRSYEDPFDDPEVEKDWVLSMRRNVEDYLRDQDVDHCEIGEWPTWHVAPITSIWAIESRISPGWVGWWVICGDHPTDYISSTGVAHPRAALRALCAQWKELVQEMRSGTSHPSIKFGKPDNWEELANLLEVRIATLENWAADDQNWDYDEAEFENS